MMKRLIKEGKERKWSNLLGEFIEILSKEEKTMKDKTNFIKTNKSWKEADKRRKRKERKSFNWRSFRN